MYDFPIFTIFVSDFLIWVKKCGLITYQDAFRAKLALIREKITTDISWDLEDKSKFDQMCDFNEPSTKALRPPAQRDDGGVETSQFILSITTYIPSYS